MEESVRFKNLNIALLLDADDVVLLAYSTGDVQQALGWFTVKYEVVGMMVSTSMSEATVLCQKMVDCPLRLGGKLLPQANKFKNSSC